MKLTQLLGAAFLAATIANTSAAIDGDLNTKDPLTLKRMLTAERRKVGPAPAHFAAIGPSFEILAQAIHAGNLAPFVTHVVNLQAIRIDAYLDALIAGDDTQACITGAATVSGAMNKGAFKAGVKAAMIGAGVAPLADDTPVAFMQYYMDLQTALNQEVLRYVESLSANAGDNIFAGAHGGHLADGTAQPVDETRDELAQAISGRVH